MKLTEKKATFEKKQGRVADKFLPLITVFAVIVVWFIAAYAYGKEIIIPKPQTALKELAVMLGQGVFWQSVANTMLRAIVAFALAYVFALAFALLSQASKIFFKLFYPLVVLLRALPTISVIFICFIAMKGWYRACFIAFLVVFPTLYASFYTAFENCSGELGEVIKAYNVNRRIAITKFVIPSVWEYMYSDIVNTLSLTVKLIIAAEAVTTTANSLGGLMAEAKSFVDMAGIFAYTVTAVVLSYATELIVRLIARAVKEVSLKCRRH